MRSGTFARRNTLTRRLLATSTIKPAAKSPEKMSASRGLPSRACSGVSPATPPNHCETHRDAQIDSHTTGIHRAEDTRDVLSRSNKKSVRTKKAHRLAAVLEDIHDPL